MSKGGGNSLSQTYAIYPPSLIKVNSDRKFSFTIQPTILAKNESYQILVKSKGDFANTTTSFFLSSAPSFKLPTLIPVTSTVNPTLVDLLNTSPLGLSSAAINFIPISSTVVNPLIGNQLPWIDVVRMTEENPNIYIVSDLHFGTKQTSYGTPKGIQKNQSDDFDSDDEFVNFLKWIQHDCKSFDNFDEKQPVLILLGDILDIWQASSETHTNGLPLKSPPINYRNYEQSINEIIKTHKKSWDALKEFCKPNNSNKVYYVVGNHDDPLYGTGQQKDALRAVVSNKINSSNFTFADAVYHRFFHFWAEHGHRWDKENWQIMPSYRKTPGQILTEQFSNIVQNLGYETKTGEDPNKNIYDFSKLNNFVGTQTVLARFLLKGLNEIDENSVPIHLDYIVRNVSAIVFYLAEAGKLSTAIPKNKLNLLIDIIRDCTTNHYVPSIGYSKCLIRKIKLILGLGDLLKFLHFWHIPSNGIGKQTAQKRGRITLRGSPQDYDPRKTTVIDTNSGDEISLMASGHTHYVDYLWEVIPQARPKLYMNCGTWTKQYDKLGEEVIENRQIWRLSVRKPEEEKRPVRELNKKPTFKKEFHVQVPSKNWSSDNRKRIVDACLLEFVENNP